MKKILASLTALTALLLGIANVSAKTVDLDMIATKLDDGTAVYNAYIIGEKAYNLNKYYLTIYDVVNAATEYTTKYPGQTAPIYYVWTDGTTTKIDVITGPSLDAYERKNATDVYSDSKVYLTAVDNVALEDDVVVTKPDIEKIVKSLDAELKDEYGFESVTHDNNTVTYKVNDPSKNLAAYKESSVADEFMAAVKDATKATYKLGDKEIEVSLEDLDKSTVNKLAAEVLTYLAGDKDLTLGNVAGKEVSATITFKDGTTETYTVKFECDFKAITEENVEAAVKTLNSELKDEYGFESVTFADNIVTYKVSDPSKNLAAYKDSNVVDLFLENIAGAEKATYKLGDTEKEVDLTNLDKTAVNKLAAEVLSYLAGDKDLTLGNVAGKEISATVTFNDGTTDTYTVKFECDFKAVTEENVEEAVKTLNSGLEEKYGFESVTYENNTVTFKINNPSKNLAAYKDSNVVDLFLENIAGAEKATYKLGDTEKEVDLANLDKTTVNKLAAEVLSYLAGDKDLTLENVAGKEISATVTFNDGTTDTYTVKFECNYEDVKNQEIKHDVAVLDSELKDEYGFASVTYENNTVTFKISDPSKELTAYKDSSAADLFLANIENATKATYKLGDTEKEIDLTGMTKTKVNKLAAEVLTYLADGGDLTLGNVKGKSISANITYVVDGVETPIEYTLVFE